MPTVSIPPPYRGPTRGDAEVQVAGQTVRECLEALNARYPGLSELLYEADGHLSSLVRLFVNGKPVTADALDTPVAATDEITILAAIAGG